MQTATVQPIPQPTEAAPSPSPSPTVTTPPSAEPPAEQNESFAFELIVLNTSATMQSVDIKVYIDGELVVEDVFINGSDMGIAYHKRYPLQLAEGAHTIEAISEIGEALLEAQFQVTQEHWAMLGYEFSPGYGYPVTPPKHFGFAFQNEPIMFE
jgi:hypothetical protein